MLESVLLHRDKQLNAMDSEGQVDDETDLVALPFTQGPR